MISNQDYLSLTYLHVNQVVLQQEYNSGIKKIKEFQTYKENFEKNQKKWQQKLQASAGDVLDNLNATTAENERLLKENEDLKE